MHRITARCVRAEDRRSATCLFSGRLLASWRLRSGPSSSDDTGRPLLDHRSHPQYFTKPTGTLHGPLPPSTVLPLPTTPRNTPTHHSPRIHLPTQHLQLTTPHPPNSQNIYYGTLYAYTPEVLPSAHRGTGNGISIALNRLMGIMSAVVATYANTATAVPIFVCAALYIVMAIVAACFPFEPMGSRSS